MLKTQHLPEHLMGHLLAMGELHRAGRYDRQADGVQQITGRAPMSVREFVLLHAEEFGGRRS
jgi:hypothetical protein